MYFSELAPKKLIIFFPKIEIKILIHFDTLPNKCQCTIFVKLKLFSNFFTKILSQELSNYVCIIGLSTILLQYF